MGSGSRSYDDQGNGSSELRPLVFPNSAARRRQWISWGLGVSVLVVLVGSFILMQVVAANAVAVRDGVGWVLALLAGLLLAPLPLVMYSMLMALGSLRSRAGMRVDAGGIHLSSERGHRTLDWDSVRGHIDVVVTTCSSQLSRASAFIRTVVVLGGDRIELPWLDVTGADERQAQQRVREHAVDLLARDPHPEVSVLPAESGPKRPASLLMEQFSANGGATSLTVRCFALIPPLALAAELAALIWGGSGYTLPLLVIPGAVGLVDLCALVYLVVLSSWLHAPTYVIADASGLTVHGRQGRWKGQYALTWDQVRGRLESQVVKVPAGWEAQVVCRADDGRDVVLTGASLLAPDERTARRMAHERIALISSYDPAGPSADEEIYSSMRLPSSSR